MAQEFERWEVLVRNLASVGVIYRALESNVLLTRVFVEGTVRPHRAESRIRLEPGDGNWELSWYRDDGMDGATVMRREELGFPAASMPGFGDILMLNKAIENPEATLRYWRLNEASHPAGLLPATPNAEIQREGEAERLPVPLGPAVSARRFESRADGMPVATHWVDGDHTLVCSRWNEELRSYRVPGSASEAGWLSLSGFDDGTVEFITRGFDDRE